MARNIEIRLDTRRLDQLRGSLDARAEALLEKTARDVEQRAKQMVPVRTGALKNSLHVEPPAKRLERIIADGMEYGVFVEFGTSKRAPKPFLTPAVEMVRRSLIKAWEALFK